MRRWMPVAVIAGVMGLLLAACAQRLEPVATELVQEATQEREALRRVGEAINRAKVDQALIDVCDPKVSDLRRIAATPERMAAWNTLCTPPPISLVPGDLAPSPVVPGGTGVLPLPGADLPPAPLIRPEGPRPPGGFSAARKPPG